MLIGTSGARKSTAIKRAASILRSAGYDKFSPDRTTKEKFFLDLAGDEGEEDAGDILDKNLWGPDIGGPHEMFICADEANDYFGINNIEFLSVLGSLWDKEDAYENRIKNGKSVYITEPYVSILAGNTQDNFYRAFPPELLSQGFFSRLLLIYSDKKEVKIANPYATSPEEQAGLLEKISAIRQTLYGEMVFSESALALRSRIYLEWEGMSDVRFDSYCNRRLDHLIKLCMIHAATRVSMEINEEDVIWANTILSHAEVLMPKALGQLGRAKNSNAANKVLSFIENDRGTGVTIEQIWAQVSTDLEKISQLVEILQGLAKADKVLFLNGGKIMTKRVRRLQVSTDIIKLEFLTKEERSMV